MTTRRFPGAKLYRRMFRIEDELNAWRFDYLEQAKTEWSQQRATAFDERAAVLADCAYQLRKAMDTLYGLPRLS